VRVAAYQAPLLASGSMETIGLIRQQIRRCESERIEILCCPEAILGGLADDAEAPDALALSVDRGELQMALSPLASETVTTIVGFTERDASGRLFNAAAVFHRGAVIGVYRKHHPAIRRSVYSAGDRLPIFTVGALTFGIVICRDSTFAEPARTLAQRGATVLFVPTNNALPPSKTGPGIVDDARRCDSARACENGVTVIRADTAGRSDCRIAYGTTGITGPDGVVRVSAPLLTATLVVGIVEAGRITGRDSRKPQRPAAPPAG
jgi:5-aminopentanamidase